MAAFLAALERSFLVSLEALASPPFREPSFDSATAALFFGRVVGESDLGFCPVDSLTTRRAFCEKSRPLSGRRGLMGKVYAHARAGETSDFKLDHYQPSAEVDDNPRRVLRFSLPVRGIVGA